MKPQILEFLLDIHQLTERAINSCKNDREQAVLEAINDIRDVSWDIKEQIFSTRILDAKISAKSGHTLKVARKISVNLDDLLDLL